MLIKVYPDIISSEFLVSAGSLMELSSSFSKSASESSLLSGLFFSSGSKTHIVTNKYKMASERKGETICNAYIRQNCLC